MKKLLLVVNLFGLGLFGITHGEMVCTTEYAPICGKAQVQCITQPCDKQPQNFSNSCELNNTQDAEYFYDGECTQNKTYIAEYIYNKLDTMFETEISKESIIMINIEGDEINMSYYEGDGINNSQFIKVEHGGLMTFINKSENDLNYKILIEEFLLKNISEIENTEDQLSFIDNLIIKINELEEGAKLSSRSEMFLGLIKMELYRIKGYLGNYEINLEDESDLDSSNLQSIIIEPNLYKYEITYEIPDNLTDKIEVNDYTIQVTQDGNYGYISFTNQGNEILIVSIYSEIKYELLMEEGGLNMNYITELDGYVLTYSEPLGVSTEGIDMDEFNEVMTIQPEIIESITLKNIDK